MTTAFIDDSPGLGAIVEIGITRANGRFRNLAEHLDVGHFLARQFTFHAGLQKRVSGNEEMCFGDAKSEDHIFFARHRCRWPCAGTFTPEPMQPRQLNLRVDTTPFGGQVEGGRVIAFGEFFNSSTH